MEFTKDAPSPARFRMWSAIHAVGAAGERRIWTALGINKLHPNLFMFLVGPPGTGKSQAINPVSVIMRRSGAVPLAPTDMTKQGLLDALANSGRGCIVDDEPFDYHFMSICISELSNFMSQYDNALAGLLTDLFDCPPINEEQKRGRGDKSVAIAFPGLSFIMGTATAHLGSTIHDDMWGSGFMARVIMVYSDEEVIPADMFKVETINTALEDELSLGLKRIGELKGPMQWEHEAADALRAFRVNQKEGAPVHNRLSHYVTRRWLHLAKLCMIAALSEERMNITGMDFIVARSWLTDAESFMPEIFKDMISHEDGQVYHELRNALWVEFLRRMRNPVPVSWIYKFIGRRASSHTVQRLLEIAEKSGFIQRVAGTDGDDAEYVPGNPDDDAGIM